MSKRISVALASVALLCAAAPAFSADNGFYAYGSAGWTDSKGRKAQSDTAIVNLGVTAFTSQADETDTGYKLQLGYRFNRHFAIEGGYMDLGRYTYDAVATVPVATRTGSVDIDAWNLTAVGSLPLTERFAVIGKLGAAAHRLKFHCAGTGIACVNPDRKASGTSLHYGLGVEWTFSPNWFVRGEYEVVRKVGDAFDFNGTNGTSRADVKMTGVGIGYRF